jgi:hemolysin III
MNERCVVSGQTRREELINSLTHGFGAFLSLCAMGLLVVSAAATQNMWHIVSSAVYGASLVLLYLASTLYHSAKDPVRKRKLKVFDHSCIYLLIAGSYTPFMLGPLRGPWGWSLFCIVWVMALSGVIFKLYFTGRFNLISTFVYIGMGWLVIFAISPLAQALPYNAIYGIFAGGLCYTLGTVFYLFKKIPYHHGLWHLSVLAGSAFHFVTILLYVIV